MKDWQSLSHVKWDCKYHVVIVSKYRNRVIYGEVRKKIGGIIRELCGQKGIEIHEGHALPDHVHLMLSIPPKYSVSNTIGFNAVSKTVNLPSQATRRDVEVTYMQAYKEGLKGIAIYRNGSHRNQPLAGKINTRLLEKYLRQA